ncbi:MAG: hypothetical protein ACR2KT_07475 [Methylocella sp.]
MTTGELAESHGPAGAGILCGIIVAHASFCAWILTGVTPASVILTY